MRVSFATLMIAASLGKVALAACPTTDAAARDARTDPLFAELAESEEPNSGLAAASRIWSIWAEAPDSRAQEMLDRGMERIRWGAFGDAEAWLTQLVDYCPDYAEGWNQRAFARFLANDLDGALADLERALDLEPRHFGALAGRGLTLLRQGRQLLGMTAIRRAVEIHPWINERRLLPPDEKI